LSSLFKVTSLGQNNKFNIPICSGLTFGWIEKELVFKLEMESAEEPLLIKFYLRKDSSRKNVNVSIGEIKDNTITVDYYNSSESGTSGLSHPLGLIETGNNILGFMFHIDSLKDSDCYKISYEFYHGSKPEPKKAK
jgi:hypothetical protein